MYPAGVVASLLALLAANGTSMLDCVCKHADRTDEGTFGEWRIWGTYCTDFDVYLLVERCENLQPPSIAVPAVARLVPTYWRLPAGEEYVSTEPAPPAGGEECGGALAAVRGLTTEEAVQLSSHLWCLIAADCLHSCSVQGLNDTEWNAETLTADHLRQPALSQLLHAFRRVTRAVEDRNRCALENELHFPGSSEINPIDFLEHHSNHWRDAGHLLAIGVAHLSQLFVPLAFEHMGNHTNGQGLHRWIRNVERVRDMLHTELIGLMRDVQSVSELTATYMIEETRKKPGEYVIRRPLLSENLLTFQERFLSFRDDFSELCEEQEPEAAKVFGLADAVYSYHFSWFRVLSTVHGIDIKDEEWQLEDRSNATLSVDTGCLQLLVDALDHPTCPLEDLPPVTVRQREQCRLQLWDDMVQRSPHIPVTSYLAYTQRTDVNLCLLAWMAVNSFGICQDVPFSMIQSVHDARCYFDSPGNESCLQSNAKDAICTVSRAILLLKCRDFSRPRPSRECGVTLSTEGLNSMMLNTSWLQVHIKPTERTLSYRDSLNSATLKYKDYKIDTLKHLEMCFMAVNILFRSLTAGVYMYVPQFHNLSGKLLLSFQITGIVQTLYSGIMYRMTGFPNLSAAVHIDSALTLLSCIWLNSFFYQMCACIHHLRPPNDLLPDEARKVFLRQTMYVLILWSIVCAAIIAVENTSKYSLFYSRTIFLLGISLSTAFNVVCFGVMSYMCLCTRKRKCQLDTCNNSEFSSMKQLLYLSIKTVFLSVLVMIIAIGFHQAQDIAQFVYYIHLATMMQGPLMFVCFVCNTTTLCDIKNRTLAWWNQNIVSLGQEQCSSGERNLAKRISVQWSRNHRCNLHECSSQSAVFISDHSEASN